MSDASNKALVYLLIIAIVVSFGGTLISLNKLSKISQTTGYAVSGGTVNVTVDVSYIVNVTDRAIDFGSGSLNGSDACRLNSQAGDFDPADCWSVAISSDNITFENIGSATINVTVNSTKDAAAFLAGTPAEFSFNCTCGSGTPGGYTTMNESQQYCCQGLTAGGSDTGELFAWVNVTLTSNTGAQTTTLLFLAEAG